MRCVRNRKGVKIKTKGREIRLWKVVEIARRSRHNGWGLETV